MSGSTRAVLTSLERGRRRRSGCLILGPMRPRSVHALASAQWGLDRLEGFDLSYDAHCFAVLRVDDRDALHSSHLQRRGCTALANPEAHADKQREDEDKQYKTYAKQPHQPMVPCLSSNSTGQI